MYSLRGDTTCSYIFHVSLSALYLFFLVIFTKATFFHRSKHPWDWLLSDSDSPGDFPCQITRLCENLRLDALVFLFATQIMACVGWERHVPELQLSKTNPLIVPLCRYTCPLRMIHEIWGLCHITKGFNFQDILCFLYWNDIYCLHMSRLCFMASRGPPPDHHVL